MDTSKEYIEMCEKAVEVQDEWNPKGRDYRAVGKERFNVWLPRQDQLQGMVGYMVGYNIWFEKLHRFYDWLQEIEDIYSWDSKCTKFTSMEQLWLAFVQLELYGKTWNGKDWVK